MPRFGGAFVCVGLVCRNWNSIAPRIERTSALVWPQRIRFVLLAFASSRSRSMAHSAPNKEKRNARPSSPTCSNDCHYHVSLLWVADGLASLWVVVKGEPKVGDGF